MMAIDHCAVWTCLERPRLPRPQRLDQLAIRELRELVDLRSAQGALCMQPLQWWFAHVALLSSEVTPIPPFDHLTIEYVGQHIPLLKPPTTAAILLPFQGLVKALHYQPLPTTTGRHNPIMAATGR